MPAKKKPRPRASRPAPGSVDPITGGLSASARAAKIQRLKENAPSLGNTKNRWTATHSLMGAVGAALALAGLYFAMHIFDLAAVQEEREAQEGIIPDVSIAEDWQADPLREAALAAAEERETPAEEVVTTPEPLALAELERLNALADELLVDAPAPPEIRPWAVELVPPTPEAEAPSGP